MDLLSLMFTVALPFLLWFCVWQLGRIVVYSVKEKS